jgi:hypothetical protein
MIVALLLLTSATARADGREELDACQLIIARAAQTSQAGTASTRQDEARLQRCRQLVRDWTLRDSRMSVDENGRPLR